MQEDMQTLEQNFNQILKKLCEDNNINDIIKVKFTNKLKNNKDDAECDPENKQILIRPTLHTFMLLRSLYHEFEHYYQYHYYRDYYNWWMDNNKRPIYEKYYNDFINIIEEDARIFGCSFGKSNGRFLFTLISIEDFYCLNGKPLGDIDCALEALKDKITYRILNQVLSNG